MTLNATGLIGPQPAHAQRLFASLHQNGFALDLSETGTGKTYTAAAVAKAFQRPVVLIAPKTVLRVWGKIFARFGVSPKLMINYELLGRGNTKWMKFKKLPDPARPHVLDAKELLPHFRFPKDALIVLDEGHRCKGLDTTNSQMLISLVVQKYTVLMCSATAATSPLDMKALGFLFGGHALFDFTDFCRLHGADWVGKWGAMSWSGDSLIAKKGMLLLNRYLFERRKCASRMVREDFGDLFPESHIIAEAYDLGTNEAKIQKVYDDMDAELMRLDEKVSGYKDHIFAILMAARRKAELLKVPTFVDMVEDLFDEGKSVALFLNFSETVAAVTSRLRKSKKYRDQLCFVIGGQTESQRETDIADFQADRKRIMILNVAAGSDSISLHDLNGKFPRASVVSPNWSAIKMLQCLGRIWRQGGLTKSYQRIVYAAGCIEENICRRVQARLTALSLLNDGDLFEATEWIR